MRLFWSVIALVLGWVGLQGFQSSPTIEELVRPSDVTNVQLSPEGGYIAVLTRAPYAHYDDDEDAPDLLSDELEDRLLIINLETGEATTQQFGRFQGLWMRWVTEDRLVGGFRLPGVYENSIASSVAASRVFAFDRDASNMVMLFEGEWRRFQESNRYLSNLASILPDDPDHILMPSARGRGVSLWRVNVHTGEAEAVDHGNARTLSWNITRDGQPIIRTDISHNFDELIVYASDAPGEWVRIEEIEINDLIAEESEFSWAASSPNDDEIYVFARPNGADRLGIHAYNVRTREFGAPIATHPRVDVRNVVRDPRTDELLATSFWDDRLEYHFLDEELRAHFNAISGFFGTDVNVVPFQRSGNKFLIGVSGPLEPLTFYLYDFETSAIDPVIADRSWLLERTLAPMEVVRYSAQDGLEISGYLTRPAGRQGLLPLIVYPHGGPEARDYFTFDRFAQAFATAGYAVFQPNFRGSGGYGNDFAEAGYGEWGGLMQQDVTDGVNWLISQGIADASRICIAGASYGGYSALIGGLQSPDIYQCAASASGVTDPDQFLDSREGFLSYDYWVELIGHPRRDHERIRATSPRQQARHYQIPILLVHSEWDRVVPIEQAELMERALRRNDRDFEYIEIERAGHDYASPEASQELIEAFIEFFDAHIGNSSGDAEGQP